MAKTRAEIQKAYRERKKLREGDKYLKKETCRVMKYYNPSSSLAETDRKKRNKIAAIRNRRHRLLVKDREQEQGEDSEDLTESGYDSSRLIVKLPVNLTISRKRRTAKALERAKSRFKRAEKKIENLNKKCKKNQKVIERLRNKISRVRKPSPLAASTPNSKTNSMVESLNITPKRAKSVKRQLLIGNVLIDEISKAKQKNKSSVLNIIAGKVVKKYRCLKGVCQSTGLSRSTISKYASKTVTIRKSVTRRCQKEVTEFFNRNDNSKTNPGKKDSKKCEDGETKQTKVLTDYLANLHQKFLTENPTYELSLATFCRLRPKNILTVKFTSIQACLCIRHQNMALKMQCLRKLSVPVSDNPERNLDLNDNIDELTKIIPDNKEINYNTWKRVDGEKNIKKMKYVNLKKSEFIGIIKTELEDFRMHVYRMKEQYQQMRRLKEQLPPNHMIVQMDFAENYTCRSVDEIQSAYWHQTAVTLHPAVAYFKLDESLQHRSFVVISNELAHNTSTVWSILDILVPQLKQIDANLEYIHYWTDSPSSQYRNKHIFHVIANHVELFNVAARWNYSEAGHGKGPCDGLGGATKRFADEAIKMGAAVIQDAADFFAWASTSTMREVKFLWLERDACQQKLEVTSCLKIKPIKGTMKYHAVSSNDTRSINVRETSCYCHDCLTGEVCSHWDLHILDYKRNTTVRDEQQRQQSVPNTTNNDIIHETVDSNTGLQQVACKDGDFVACVYDRKWYIGFVSEVDEDDVNVSFMQASKAMFKWPQPPDEIWVDKNNILCTIRRPEPFGKFSRVFTINDEDRCNIENIYTMFPNTP